MGSCGSVASKDKPQQRHTSATPSSVAEESSDDETIPTERQSAIPESIMPTSRPSCYEEGAQGCEEPDWVQVQTKNQIRLPKGQKHKVWDDEFRDDTAGAQKDAVSSPAKRMRFEEVDVDEFDYGDAGRASSHPRSQGRGFPAQQRGFQGGTSFRGAGGGGFSGGGGFNMRGGDLRKGDTHDEGSEVLFVDAVGADAGGDEWRALPGMEAHRPHRTRRADAMEVPVHDAGCL